MVCFFLCSFLLTSAPLLSTPCSLGSQMGRGVPSPNARSSAAQDEERGTSRLLLSDVRGEVSLMSAARDNAFLLSDV